MTNRTASVYLFIGLLCIYTLTAGGHYGGDGFWNYLTARSLVIEGDLSIGDQAFGMREMQHQYDAVSSSGRTYSKYGLGLPLVEIPFFIAGYLLSKVFTSVPPDYLTMFTVSLTNVLICALWGLGFFRLVLRLGFSRATACLLTGIFGLGSMVFPYAGYGFSEPLVGIALLGAVGGCYYYTYNQSPWSLVVASVCMGLAALTKLYALIALPAFIWYIWPTYRKQFMRALATVAFIAPISLFAWVIAWYNAARYGSIFKTGYHLDLLAQQGGYFAFWPAQIATALYGLLFSTGRGLIFFLPIICLFPTAYRTFKTAHAREARLCLALIVLHIAFLLPMIDWHGGSSWGPRYLLPIIPYCILPFGSLVEKSRSGYRSVAAFGLLGALVQLPGALANPHLFVRFAREKQIGDLIFDPGHTGDLIFSPYLSPILGGYYQLASALAGKVTGQSLHYVISSGVSRTVSASLENYDLIDVWWLNALRTGMLGSIAASGLYAGVIILIAILLFAARQLLRWQRQPEG